MTASMPPGIVGRNMTLTSRVLLPLGVIVLALPGLPGASAE